MSLSLSLKITLFLSPTVKRNPSQVVVPKTHQIDARTTKALSRFGSRRGGAHTRPPIGAAYETSVAASDFGSLMGTYWCANTPRFGSYDPDRGSVVIPANQVLFVNNDRHALKVCSSESKSALTYTEDASKSHNDILANLDSSTEEYVNGEEIGEPVQHVVSEQKRAAKIHDFCFGIPYGGIVFSGGLIGFIFSRNPATLISGGLYGGALLALSILSLKIWRQGQSSLPFILGQAGLAAALLWKNMQTYSLTEKILPTGIYAVISAAMLCFYTYVVVSGGNPPPKKKLKSTAASPP